MYTLCGKHHIIPVLRDFRHLKNAHELNPSHLAEDRYYLKKKKKNLEITSAGKDVQQSEPCAPVVEYKMVYPSRKEKGGSSKNKELSYDLAIPLLDVYPKGIESRTQDLAHDSFSSQHWAQEDEDRGSPNCLSREP